MHPSLKITGIFLVAAVSACSAFHHPSDGASDPLVIAKQGSFFVGGQEIKDKNLSLLPR
jgi:hypothetical protein